MTREAMREGLRQIVSEVLDHASLRHSSLHGEIHWRSVAHTGLLISQVAKKTDRTLLFLFGLTHDMLRVDDGYDLEHGARAAGYVRSSASIRSLIGEERQDALARACFDHSKNMVLPSEPRIGACWDADRLNLIRDGIIPEEEYFSVLSGKAFSILRVRVSEEYSRPPSWDQIISAV